jgi:hypothetical protein
MNKETSKIKEMAVSIAENYSAAFKKWITEERKKGNRETY